MVGNIKKDIIFEIYKDSRSVFKINDIALLLDNADDTLLSQKLNYYVKAGKLLNPRRGIYAKEGYKAEELACLLYTPTYISFGYVLQRSSVIFQYDSAITNASYLCRSVKVDNQPIEYRQIKDEILLNTTGIVRENNINIAVPERALLDTLYLGSSLYFDNIKPLNRNKINELLPVYNSETLNKKVKRVFQL
jgi:hypothetical protein